MQISKTITSASSRRTIAATKYRSIARYVGVMLFLLIMALMLEPVPIALTVLASLLVMNLAQVAVLSYQGNLDQAWEVIMFLKNDQENLWSGSAEQLLVARLAGPVAGVALAFVLSSISSGSLAVGSAAIIGAISAIGALRALPIICYPCPKLLCKIDAASDHQLLFVFFMLAMWGSFMAALAGGFGFIAIYILLGGIFTWSRFSEGLTVYEPMDTPNRNIAFAFWVILTVAGVDYFMAVFSNTGACSAITSGGFLPLPL